LKIWKIISIQKLLMIDRTLKIYGGKSLIFNFYI